MAQLILLVVAAAWLAVLIPPMLRSRVENRPNSSVTDFRRQLTKLQHTATPPRGGVRTMGRPLAQSPLSRPVAAGRPVQPTMRSGVTRQPSKSELAASGNTATVPSRPVDPTVDGQRFRTHGDPTGGQRRPVAGQQRERSESNDQTGSQRRPRPVRDEHRPLDDEYRETGRRSHGDPTGGQRRPAAAAAATSAPRSPAKQRRSNILFVLVITTACTLFLAATTGSTVMLYGFVLAFLALCGFVYLLAQSGQREAGASYDDWLC
jgi:hypothetical protein